MEDGTIATVTNANHQENVAVVIQAAIRRFLALKELQKLKKVIKLQAALRGHLVRRQAVGSLRCVQAIIKLQALVRARLACQALEKCSMQKKHDNGIQIDSQWSTVSPKRNSQLTSDKTNSAVDKLLSNGFARQLLDTTPKTKPIYISCDSLRPDSAWHWLERWMAVTSPGQQTELDWNQGCQEEDGKNVQTSSDEIDGIPVMVSPTLPILNMSESKPAAAEDKGDSTDVTSGTVEFQVQASNPGQRVVLSAKDQKVESQGEEDLSTKKDNISMSEKAERISNVVSNQLKVDATTLSEVDSNPSKPVFVTENLKCTAMTAASDPMETEGKKLETGLKKLRNPAFAAVQAKFEELSSAPKASRSISYICRDATVETKPNHNHLESMAAGDVVIPVENTTTQNPAIHVAASECGTEISISSTLDSPDQSEADRGEITLELGTLEGRHDVQNGSCNAFNLENVETKAKEPSAELSVKQQEHEENDKNIIYSISAFQSVQEKEKQTELSTSTIQIQQENLKDSHSNDRLSQEGSPKSYVNIPESDGTPSSKVTVSSRTRKAEKKNAAGKSKDKLFSKSSPSNLKNDSGERSSTERLPKDAKNNKRRSSFGITKPDNSDSEPRLSCSSTLPSYMQATESARSKANGTLSLKSSPDVHDKDNHIKKRHSLPISDDKQGSSPRVQRSASQVHKSLKGNDAHSPHTSAERRWQR
ncbi:protein IQ-DOMAIN 32 [Iris pallida]|uniref:Protein IQ-DOMAIN 32 n=1 Tax=Iris pallida TaxID=29817 RepID=A0AAX6GVN9_IRIPA|nr:protein IQ-DOMAIN 32 [Iris pallida]